MPKNSPLLNDGETEVKTDSEAEKEANKVAEKAKKEANKVAEKAKKEANKVAEKGAVKTEAPKTFMEELKAGPQTQFIIPLTPGESEGAAEFVSLNGAAFTIKKGALVTIPVPIAEILGEKYRVEMTAGRDKLMDRSEDVVTALS